jgi:hypothetical protein
MLFRPPCALCGQPSATLEVLDPHELPSEWAGWGSDQQRRFRQYRNDESHLLRYSGPGGSNGAVGDAIEAARAARIVAAFSGPMTAEIMASLEFFDHAGFCLPCGRFYCPAHRPVSSTGWGTCPEGHGQSLDPHWSPDMDD